MEDEETKQEDRVLRVLPSIELHRNAKGEYSWKIKCSNDDIKELEKTIDDMNKRLKEKYTL